jgi:arabinose-5-phosphate isomerase
MTEFNYSQSARRTIELEAHAVTELRERIDSQFDQACRLILACTGRVIVSGMGKSGHMGRKIAATLVSTGTPAFFMHPGEASHGDLGMLTRADVLIAISYSGNATELVTLLPVIKRLGVPMISMTGAPQSSLARAADAHLNIAVGREACPLSLAPTSSATVTTVLGDALAIALLEARGFTAEDFALSHPGGALGRKLLLRVKDIMHGPTELPAVSPRDTLAQALLEMTSKGFGMTTVTHPDGTLAGIFTDGDLRRSIDSGADIHTAVMEQLMHTAPATTGPDILAAEALNIMQTRKITALVVTDQNHTPCGVVHMHDLLRAGVI